MQIMSGYTSDGRRFKMSSGVLTLRDTISHSGENDV